MKMQELIPAMEAVLFSSGDPISLDRLTQIFEETPERIEKAAASI